MHWLHEQYAQARYQDALRESTVQIETDATYTQNAAPAQPKLRQALGGKLIAWGKRLQETPIVPEPLQTLTR